MRKTTRGEVSDLRTIDISGGGESEPLSQLDISLALTGLSKIRQLPETEEVANEALSKTSARFLSGYFNESPRLQELRLQHAPYLAAVFAHENAALQPRGSRTEEEVFVELLSYFVGLRDVEIGREVHRTPAAIQIYRSNLFSRIKQGKGDEWLAERLEHILDTVELNDDLAEEGDSESEQQTEAEIFVPTQEVAIETETFEEQKVALGAMYAFCNQLFQSQGVSELQAEHLDALLTGIANHYLPVHKKPMIARVILNRLGRHFSGDDDRTMGMQAGISAQTIYMSRANIIAILQRDYPESRLTDLLTTVLSGANIEPKTSWRYNPRSLVAERPNKEVHVTNSEPPSDRVREERDLMLSDINPSDMGSNVRIIPLAEPEDLTWQEVGLCNQTDPEAFFPEKGGSTRAAKEVCTNCDVRVPCLDYALKHDERFGIWGGLSERERRRLKKAAL